MGDEGDWRLISETIGELEDEVGEPLLEFFVNIPPLSRVWLQNRDPLVLLLWSDSLEEVHNEAEDYPIETEA